MMAVFVVGSVSLLWGLVGLVAILFPEWVVGGMVKSIENPWRRYWIAQGLLLCGLVLMVGTLILEGFWLWVGCGLIMVLKACVLLGLSDSLRERFLRTMPIWPHWSIRVGGVLNLSLAVLLAGELILHG